MSKKYKLLFNKRYLKDLEKIPKKDREHIKESFSMLADDPRPNGCKKLKGYKRAYYRIRSGDYRIVYTIEDDVLLVLAIGVGHRKSIYQ